MRMSDDPCGVCGGDGRISVASRTTSCPSCHGSGRRQEDRGFHDVTKTKPSHHEPAAAKREKPTEPESALGRTLAREVREAGLSDDETKRLIDSILEYEARKGEVTKTFSRLLRKQLRGGG